LFTLRLWQIYRNISLAQSDSFLGVRRATEKSLMNNENKIYAIHGKNETIVFTIIKSNENLKGSATNVTI